MQKTAHAATVYAYTAYAYIAYAYTAHAGIVCSGTGYAGNAQVQDARQIHLRIRAQTQYRIHAHALIAAGRHHSTPVSGTGLR